MANRPLGQPHRLARKIISTRPMAWFLSHTAHLFDRFLMARTGGRYSVAALMTGLPVISLTTTGARSGQPRTVPLLGIPDGKNLILIASNWGQRHHPGWYYNIQATPQVHVETNGQIVSYMAHRMEGMERQRCWQTAVQCYPGYEAYKKWTNGREIPVFLLTPANKQ
ncbi:MAG: nitroreductase/quinone reductase family protein [Candidatus Promineifilaceae bacterium]